MTEQNETGIVPVEPIRALVTPEQAKADWERFLALKAALLTPEDYQTYIISGEKKQYVRKSGFRKLAFAFGLSDRIVDEQRTDRPDGSIVWRIVVEVSHPNGRISTGVGICDSAERKPREEGKSPWAHMEHDVYSTAHTRAKNRAIADMIAAGMVSAEEMEPEQTIPDPTSAHVVDKRDTAHVTISTEKKPAKKTFGNQDLFRDEKQ